ncbi:MAG: DNA primase catalytic subunit PriS, partial [Candidatus Heimdallarchaeaceae archaeon]
MKIILRLIRNISFPNSTKLTEFMSTRAVKDAYIGAVYDRPPSKENPIQKIKWVRRELIFDLDIDEYDLVRTCGCQGDEFCVECWTLIQDAVIFLEETMREDFGVEEIRWIFSGRRGVHGWILDRDPQYFDQATRTAILNYLSFIQDKKRSQSIDEIPNEAKLLRNRIYSIIAKSYLSHTTPEELKELADEVKAKLSLNKAKSIISQVRNNKNFDYNTYNMLILDDSNLRKKLSHEIILKRYPRIDRKVTMDTRRVSRIPYSIHRKTGKIAVEIEDILKFDPFNSET